MTEEAQAEKWLEKRFLALEALYHRFGRDGFKGQPLSDVRLWLTSKELQLRDMGRNLSVEQQQAGHQLELEIHDIGGYLRGQIEGLSLADLRTPRPDRARHDHQRHFSRDRKPGMER